MLSHSHLIPILSVNCVNKLKNDYYEECDDIFDWCVVNDSGNEVT